MRLLLPLFLLLATLGAREASYLVGFAQDTMANDWRVAQVHQLRDELAADGEIEFIYKDGDGSLALSMQNVDDFVAMGVDVLVASPIDTVGMRSVLERAYHEGIAVVLLTRQVAGDSYTTFIRPDDRKIGAEAAAFISRELGGQGRVLMLQGLPTASTAIDRSEGFLRALRSEPDLHLAGIEVGNYLRADAIRAMERVIAAGTEFDAIFAQSDSMAIGAIMALEKAGIDPASKVIVGVDYISQARELIASGKLRATYLYPTAAKEGAQAVRQILAGESVEKDQVLPTVRITKENLDKVEPIF